MTARVRLSPTIWSWRAWHEEPAGHYPLRRGIPAGRRRPAHLLAGSLPGSRRRAELHTLAPLPEPYTQADLDEALALRTEGYEAQSVAAFDRALADWTNEAAFHAREERIRRLLCSYEEDGPEAEFVLGTLAAAMGACSARHYGGYCTQITPAYADAASYTRSEDVFGDSYVVYEASASYTIRYQMPDESRLTVGERDRILTRYRDAVQAFLDGKTEDELSKEEAMTRALKRELKRLDQSLSTQWMALEGTRLDDYFAYGPEGARHRETVRPLPQAHRHCRHGGRPRRLHLCPLWDTPVDRHGRRRQAHRPHHVLYGCRGLSPHQEHPALSGQAGGLCRRQLLPLPLFLRHGSAGADESPAAECHLHHLPGVLAVWVRRRPWPAPSGPSCSSCWPA